MSEYLSAPEAANYLGIGERTVRELLASRELPFVRIRRRVVIRRVDLDAYCDKHREPAGA